MIDQEWDVMVDLFFYRKVEDVEEQAFESKESGDKAGKGTKKWDTYEEEGNEEENWNV